MAAGRVTQPGGPRVGRPSFTISIDHYVNLKAYMYS